MVCKKSPIGEDLATLGALRDLTKGEIATLEAQGCDSSAWDSIRVSEGFTPEGYKKVFFSGECILEAQDPKRGEAVSETRLHNCIIESGVELRDIPEGIHNYRIASGVRILRVSRLYYNELENCGEGTPIHLLDETGSHSLPALSELTPLSAYLLLFARHSPRLINSLGGLASKTLEETHTGCRGYIAGRCRIEDCGDIYNLQVSPSADEVVIARVPSLRKATLHSGVHIEDGALLEEVVVQEGSSINSYTTLNHCFIGRNSSLRNGFSGEHCFISDHCDLACGEAVASVLGPHTVSHHRSTLLVGSCISFFNAGSGTNQSNHHYRLGPMHFGIAERGCKSASDAYILWPACIGAYSKVVGRITSQPFVHDFPCSTLTQEGNATRLDPGNLLRGIGLYRDVWKWEQRGRTLQEKKGNNTPGICYKFLNDALVSSLVRGYKRLQEELKRHPDAERHILEGCYLSHEALKAGIESYRTTLLQYLVKRISEGANLDFVDGSHTDEDRYHDCWGFVVRQSDIEVFFEKIQQGEISDLRGLELFFKAKCNKSSETLFLSVIALLSESKIASLSVLNTLLEEARERVPLLLKAAKRDAEKELSPRRTTAFGIFASTSEEVKEEIRLSRERHLHSPFFEGFCRRIEGLETDIDGAIQAVNQALEAKK